MPRVLTLGRGRRRTVAVRLLRKLGLTPRLLPPGRRLPGSYWGSPEAGLVRERIYLRADTPLHSALHEGLHALLMGPRRRRRLLRDAGGDESEENAVNLLAIRLAPAIPGFGRPRLLADMDRWGYSFRLGSARRWAEEDAVDAHRWLGGCGIRPLSAAQSRSARPLGRVVAHVDGRVLRWQLRLARVGSRVRRVS